MRNHASALSSCGSSHKGHPKKKSIQNHQRVIFDENKHEQDYTYTGKHWQLNMTKQTCCMTDDQAARRRNTAHLSGKKNLWSCDERVMTSEEF